MTISDNKILPTDSNPVDPHPFWQNSHAAQALLFSLFAGVIGVNLFADLPLGLNILCFALLILLGFVGMRYATRTVVSAHEISLIALTLFFCTSLVWRESPVLNALSVLSLVALGIITVGISKQRHWLSWYLRDSGQDSLSAMSYITSTPIHLGKTSYQETLSLLQRSCDQQTSEAVVRGLMFAVPIIVIFALLLMNADARFESTISHLFDWDFGGLWSNAGLFIGCFMLAAILQRAAGSLATKQAATNALDNNTDDSINVDEPIVKKTYRIEIGIVLALVNLLFLSFVWVQFSYFFGGDAMVQDLTGPSYSEYARRGFFQLMIVTLLVMLMLLSSYALFKPTTLQQQRWFQGLAGSLIVLTWIIELSAIHRMFIYVQAYGLTELRFYSSVMMGWVAVVLLWFSLSVLRHRAGLFFVGAISSALVSVALLHVVNPDAMIMRTNLDRLMLNKHFDAQYIDRLSADMIPVVAQRLPALHDNEQTRSMSCVVSRLLTRKSTAMANDDSWLAWHWARYQSDKAMEGYVKPECF